MSAGQYIICEGIDGCGKSTQARLLAERFRQNGYEVLEVSEPYEEREPGRLLRRYLKEKRHPYALFGLFLAQRFDLLAEVVKPAVAAGKIVISSRGFPSTFVYQVGDAPGAVTTNAVQFAHDPRNLHVTPDHIFVFDLSAETAMERIGKRGEGKEIFEKTELLEQFRGRYKDPLFLWDGGPLGETLKDRLHVIDATQPVETVAEQVWSQFAITEALCKGLGVPRELIGDPTNPTTSTSYLRLIPDPLSEAQAECFQRHGLLYHMTKTGVSMSMGEIAQDYRRYLVDFGESSEYNSPSELEAALHELVEAGLLAEYENP